MPQSLEPRHRDSDSLCFRVADTDIHALDASFRSRGLGIAMKLHEYQHPTLIICTSTYSHDRRSLLIGANLNILQLRPSSLPLNA